MSSLGNLQSDVYIIFQKGVNNFEIEYKTCFILSYGCSTPWSLIKNIYHLLIFQMFKNPYLSQK